LRSFPREKKSNLFRERKNPFVPWCGHGRRRRLDHGEVPPVVDSGAEPAGGGPRGRGVLPRGRASSLLRRAFPRPPPRAAAGGGARAGGRGGDSVRGVHGGDRAGGGRGAAAVRPLVPPRLHRAVARHPEHLPPLPRRAPAQGRRGGGGGPREAAGCLCRGRQQRRRAARRGVVRAPRRRRAVRMRQGGVIVVYVFY
jgi:hypothetical protein